MTEPRKNPDDEAADRFVLDDVKGLRLDRSEEEGEPIDFGDASDDEDDA